MEFALYRSITGRSGDRPNLKILQMRRNYCSTVSSKRAPSLPSIPLLFLMTKQQLHAATAVDRRLGFGRRHHHLFPLPTRHPSNHTAAITRFAACFFVFLLAIAAAVTLALALALTLHRSAPTAHAAPPRGGYTVAINTWKRDDLLRRSVAHYSTCPGVDAVRVVWSEPLPPSDALYRSVLSCSRCSANAVGIGFVINKEDSLNNRFRPIHELKTDAVFSVDDDVIVPCSTLRFAFSVWCSMPSAMVGFVPRMHWPSNLRSDTEEYRYGGWWSVWWTGTYSMVLSKASFFHKQYLDLYTNHMLPSIRDYVNKNRNCEDIAMSFLIANVTRAPPVWVEGRIFEIGSKGISSLKGHDLQRSKCLNTFAAMYGHMPLVATTIKAIDSRRSWSW